MKNRLSLSSLREEPKKEQREPYNHNNHNNNTRNVLSIPQDMYKRSPEEKYKLPATIEHLNPISTTESCEIPAKYNIM